MFKYIFILLFCISNSFAQNINQYKYVEVPQRFDFQKENNVYNLNVLTKMLLEKYGFVAYMNDEIKPGEATANFCAKVLHVNLEEESTLFVRKLTVKLLDCQNNVVFTTKQGQSSTKDLRVAYNQALRMSFESFNALGYKYNEDASAKVVASLADRSAKVATAQKDNSAKAAIVKEDISAKATQIRNSDNSAKVKIVTEDKLAKATRRTNSDSSAKVETKVVEFEFTAKAVENGFLLQSASLPEIRMQKSSVDHYYIAQIGDLPGMIYKVGNVWKLDYYKNGELLTKLISIKF